MSPTGPAAACRPRITPLSAAEYQVKAKNHALLCAIGFLVILPLGTLYARFARTRTNRWVYVHWAIQVLIAGPIILAGSVLGHQLAGEVGATPHYTVDKHQKIGLALLVLYFIQVVLGPIERWFKFRINVGGAMLNVHVLIGLAVLSLAAYQVHLGLYVEWGTWFSKHPLPASAKHAWLAALILFWVPYLLRINMSYNEQSSRADMIAS